jgi:hypothetical protein
LNQRNAPVASSLPCASPASAWFQSNVGREGPWLGKGAAPSLWQPSTVMMNCNHNAAAPSEAPGPASQAGRPAELPVWRPFAPPAAAGAAGLEQQLGPRWGVPHPGAQDLAARHAGRRSSSATQQLSGILLPGQQHGASGTAGSMTAAQPGQAVGYAPRQTCRLTSPPPINAAAAAPPRGQHAAAQQAAAAMPSGSTATSSGALTVHRGATPSPARLTPTSAVPARLRQHPQEHPQLQPQQPHQPQHLQQTTPASAAATAAALAAAAAADGPRQVPEAADTKLLQDRQAVLEGLVLQLWEAERQYAFKQQSARRLKE